MHNRLTLAVAGSRKTQGIIEACRAAPTSERILILTYTSVNQSELRSRLAQQAGEHVHVEVMGWFSFLIRHLVRPHLPYLFLGRRVHGFDFDSEPQQGSSNTSYRRYFTTTGLVRKTHLPQLAARVESSSGGQGIGRLSQLYDRIFIDEVQDLCGYDLEILDLLMESKIPVSMVGDIRQAVIATNPRELKNKAFMYMGIWAWFRKRERDGKLVIDQRAVTERCRAEIATFADSIFDSSWGFDPTTSTNSSTTGHDGLFAVRRSDVPAYVAQYSPLILRDSANSAKNETYTFTNFTVSKGMTSQRVLIWPTAKIESFLNGGPRLSEIAASKLYVAVTRAEQSVAFVIESAQAGIAQWETTQPSVFPALQSSAGTSLNKPLRRESRDGESD